MVDPSCARSEYEAGVAHARERIAELATKNLSLVWIRTICFVLALICLVFGYAGDEYRGLLQCVGWLAAAGFMLAIVRHEHLRQATLMHKSDQRLFDRLLARLDRRWADLPESKLLPEYAELNFADDLDVAGNASLLTWLNLAGTLPGNRTLQKWIAETPSWQQVFPRQRAVQLLKDQRALRLSIIKTVTASSDGSEDVYGLPKWAASPAWLPQNVLAHVLSYIGPTLVLAGAAVLAAGSLWAANSFINTGAILLGLGFLINILVTVFWGSWIHDIFQQVTGQHRAVYQFADVFESFEHLPDDGGLLTDIRQAAIDSPTSARRGFPRLLWIVRLANLQRDVMMYVLYLLLQLSILWDFRVLKAARALEG